MSPPPRCAQHLPGVLHHRGGELPGYGRGSAGGGPKEDGVVRPVEDGPPAGPVLHAGKHLLERPALPQNQPQYQRSIPGRRGHGSGVEVRTVKHVVLQSIAMFGWGAGQYTCMLEGNKILLCQLHSFLACVKCDSKDIKLSVFTEKTLDPLLCHRCKHFT